VTVSRNGVFPQHLFLGIASHRIVESFKLEETIKIIESNH